MSMPSEMPMQTRKLDEQITALAKAIRELHHREQRGPLAELRRMDTAGPPVSNALQQLLAKLYPDRLFESDAGRIALFARILALPMSADGLVDGSRMLGGRMQQVGVSENRLQRLLLARGDAFGDQLLLLARRLVNAGPLPFREIGQLILGDAKTIERARYEIARGYWVARTSASSPETPSSGDLE